jgi:hypothetical protein
MKILVQQDRDGDSSQASRKAHGKTLGLDWQGYALRSSTGVCVRDEANGSRQLSREAYWETLGPGARGVKRGLIRAESVAKMCERGKSGAKITAKRAKALVALAVKREQAQASDLLDLHARHVRR